MRSWAGRRKAAVLRRQRTWGACCLQADLRNLVPYLRENDKRVLLVAGLLTSVCVLFTAASAAQLGFLAAVVEDCCADRPEKHERTLDGYQFMFDRTTTDAIREQHANWLAALAELDGHGVAA